MCAQKDAVDFEMRLARVILEITNPDCPYLILPDVLNVKCFLNQYALLKVRDNPKEMFFLDWGEVLDIHSIIS